MDEGTAMSDTTIGGSRRSGAIPGFIRSSSAVEGLNEGGDLARECLPARLPETMAVWCPWQDSNLQPAV
jgi:hypothetical protein